MAVTLLDGDGQPRYTVHQLRHRRGTELTENGQRLDVVQRALGHKDPRSTQLYADVTEDDVRRALEMRRYDGARNEGATLEAVGCSAVFCRGYSVPP